MSVSVKNNNIDGALRILRNQAAPTLSAVRDRKEYKKPGTTDFGTRLTSPPSLQSSAHMSHSEFTTATRTADQAQRNVRSLRAASSAPHLRPRRRR